MDGALRHLAALDAQRLAALDELARIHRDRVAVIQEMRVTMGPGRIADLLGVSRQQVHKLLRGE